MFEDQEDWQKYFDETKDVDLKIEPKSATKEGRPLFSEDTPEKKLIERRYRDGWKEYFGSKTLQRRENAPMAPEEDARPPLPGKDCELHENAPQASHERCALPGETASIFESIPASQSGESRLPIEETTSLSEMDRTQKTRPHLVRTISPPLELESESSIPFRSQLSPEEFDLFEALT